MGFPYSSVGKESACNAGDLGLIPRLGRFPGEGNGNPLQYFCLEIPMVKGAWKATVCGIIAVGYDLVTKPPPIYSVNIYCTPPWTEEPGRLQSMASLESDTTEQLRFHFSLSCIGEGNGNPLQCFCLENSRDGEAWWAAIYGVAQSRTRLKRLSSCSSNMSTILREHP